MLAERYLFEDRPAVVQTGADSRIFSLATKALDLFSTTQHQSYQDLGQALASTRWSLSGQTCKKVQALHEAFSFSKHLTELDETKFLNTLREELAVVTVPGNEDARQDCGGPGYRKVSSKVDVSVDTADPGYRMHSSGEEVFFNTANPDLCR